jgi:hypothetical protein
MEVAVTIAVVSALLIGVAMYRQNKQSTVLKTPREEVLSAQQKSARGSGNAARAANKASIGKDVDKKYRAVGIRPQLHSCQAVHALENIRFLAQDAPHFPVNGCDSRDCRCQYIYFSDRRDEERRSLFGADRNLLPMTVEIDRRHRERRNPAR